MNYVNPNRQIPKFIEDLIGIKTEDVNNSKYLPIEEEFKNLEELLTPDMVFTAHCVGVDYGMYNYLHYTKYKSHFETITLDTCRLAKKIIGFEKGSIGDVARELDITCGKHHQPDFDAFVAAQVLIKSIDLAESNQELKKSFLSYLVKYPRPQTLKKLLKFNLMNEAAG